MVTTPTLWRGLEQANITDAAYPGRGGSSFQSGGQIVGLPDGGYVVVWQDASRTYNPKGGAIVGQKFEALGGRIGEEVKISQFDSGDQNLPAVALLSDGNIAVVFEDFRLSDSDIYVRIFDAELNPVRTDTIDNNIDLTYFPAITALAGGGYVVSYTLGDFTGADTDVVARVVSASGVVGGRFDILNEGDQSSAPAVATLSNGNVVLVLQDQYMGSSSDYDIKFAIVTPAGALARPPIFVEGAYNNDSQVQPDVAALKGGGFVVAWTAFSGSGDIRATVFDNAGDVVNSSNFLGILVNTTTAGNQTGASVVGLADGGFLVSWRDSGAGVMQAQRFDAAGNKVGVEFTVKGSITDDAPDSALLSDGRFAFAFAHSTSGNYDVLTSIWDPRTSPIIGTNGDDTLTSRREGAICQGP